MKKLLGMLIMVAVMAAMCVSASASDYKPVPGSKEVKLNDLGFNVTAVNEREIGKRLVIFLDGDSEEKVIIKRWVRLEKVGGVSVNKKVENLDGGWNMSTVSTGDKKQTIELVMYYIQMPDSYVEKKVINYSRSVPVNLDDVVNPTAHERRVR